MKMYRVFGAVLGMLTVLSAGGVGKVCGQVVYRNLKSFTRPAGEVEPAGPSDGVIEGSDDALYGTSYGGTSPATYGTVYKINKDGSGFKVIRAFTQVANPTERLLEGGDGYLYGTTYYGRTIFKMNKDGGDFVELHHFQNDDVEYDGSAVGALVQGSTGALYGVTSLWGYGGVIFRINTDGTGYTNLHRFAGGNSDGFQPGGGLLFATNGYLYGSTTLGGEFNSGTLFRINQDGSGYEVIKEFSSTDGGGNRPLSALVQGSDGFLYGGTGQVNSNSSAAIFRVGLDGSGYTVIRQFDGSVSPPVVFSSITFGSDGRLYVVISGAIYRLDLDGGNPVLLKNFTQYDGNGIAAPLFGSDGVLYGTAAYGGVNGKGTLYRLNTDGSDFEVLKYMIPPGGDAAQPTAPLLLASDGNLYGTTLTGGATNVGAIFKMSRDGSGYSILKSFGGIDGQAPMAGLVEGADGGMYGTTSGGGSNGLGVVFKVNKDGSAYRVLWNFNGAPDGMMTNAGVAPGLTMDANQVLYGVTPLGGSNGGGTIFRINSDGTGYSLLKHFAVSPEGEGPQAELLLGADGALYGTTVEGGAYGWGVIFRIQRDGSGFTALRSIQSRVSRGQYKNLGRLVEDDNGILYGALIDGVFKIGRDGSNYAVVKGFPNSATDGTELRGLVRGIDGYLYGTLYGNLYGPGSPGGGTNLGTVFRLSPDGKNLSLLKNFTGTNGDGSRPWSVLTASSDGTLYGTTSAGGDSGAGIVFSLEPAVVMSAPTNAGGSMQLWMTTGIPGRTYTVQRATSLAGPWTSLMQVTIGAGGVADFQDSNPPQGGAFYRTAYP